MKSKTIISIVLLVVVIIAGYFAYNMFLGSANPIATSTSTVTSSPRGSILPHGTNLDFTTIKKFNPTGRSFTYPAVKPEDTGLQLNELFQGQ